MKNTTVTIQIGNSDNKLRQVQWADFIEAVEKLLSKTAVVIHFAGGSDPRASWQNFCWVIEIPPERMPQFKASLLFVGSAFFQDSIAVTEGETLFV